MNIVKWVRVQLPVLMCLVLVTVFNVSATDIPVYKGALRVSIVAGSEGNTLLLQYRTKTRQVLRVGVHEVSMTNSLTQQVTRLSDASASLATGHDEGDLYADIEYGGLSLSDNGYRVEGSLVVYLAGSQQSRNFRVDLNEQAVRRPENSSIDWGINNPAR